MNELDAPETFIPNFLSLPHDVVLCISEYVNTISLVSESFKQSNLTGDFFRHVRMFRLLYRSIISFF
jgi:hypothetical protein